MKIMDKLVGKKEETIENVAFDGKPQYKPEFVKKEEPQKPEIPLFAHYDEGQMATIELLQGIYSELVKLNKALEANK